MKVFMLNFFKDNLLILFICAVAFFIMLLFSPFTAMYWLLLFTFYYLFKAKYKNIFIIWSFFFFTWYLVFTLLLVGYEGKILIGGEHTNIILNYLAPRLLKYPFISGFALITVFSLHFLSDSLGFVLYVPSIFNGLISLIKFFIDSGKDGSGRGSTGFSARDSGTYKKPASPDVSPEPSPNLSPTSDFGFFKNVSKGSPDPSPKVPNLESSSVVTKLQEDYMKDAMRKLEKRRPWIKSLKPVDVEYHQTSKDCGIVCLDAYMPITKYRGTEVKGCLTIKGKEVWEVISKYQNKDEKK